MYKNNSHRNNLDSRHHLCAARRCHHQFANPAAKPIVNPAKTNPRKHLLSVAFSSYGYADQLGLLLSQVSGCRPPSRFAGLSQVAGYEKVSNRSSYLGRHYLPGNGDDTCSA
jgi:hypothetical protein